MTTWAYVSVLETWEERSELDLLQSIVRYLKHPWRRLPRPMVTGDAASCASCGGTHVLTAHTLEVKVRIV